MDASTASMPLTGIRGLLGRIRPQYFSSTLVTLILVIGQWKYQILGSYVDLALALGSALVTEIVLSLLLRGKFPALVSGYISGNSVAIMSKPQSGLAWPFGVGGAIAVASKYVLTYRGRHLWNPTNFSLCAFLLLAPGSFAILSHEWGNDPRANLVIWIVGLIVVLRAKVLHLTLTYLAAFAVLAVGRAWLRDIPPLAELAPATGVMYQFFVFFMITDPRTIVSKRRDQIVVVILIALLECALRLLNDYQVPGFARFAPAPAMFALFFVGPIAMWWDLRRQAPRA